MPKLGDLGYTVYCGLEDVSCPVVINFADTIVEDHSLFEYADAFYYAKDCISEKWTFFEEQNGCITNICDKRVLDFEKYAKLFVGVFKLQNPKCFQNCLKQAFVAKNSEVSTFYLALQKYSERYPMTPIKTDQWLDIGHAANYSISNVDVKAREFNHIAIDKNKGILKKTSDNKEKFIGEIKWYLKLPVEIEYVRPRIFAYSVSYENPFVEMEYYAYHTVHELFLYGDLTKNQWRRLFEKIRFVCQDFQRYSVTGSEIQGALRDMYLTKTIKRMEMLREKEAFNHFFVDDIMINGKIYHSLDSIKNILKVEIPKRLMGLDRFYIIHGDLCFTNILIDSDLSFVKFIDPRGKFGKFDIYGDGRYELAKMLHSVDGKYDFIIKDLFDLSYDTQCGQIQYKILDRSRKFNVCELFLEVFESEIGSHLKEIELIEGLLFLSMIPLHGENLQHQMVMLGVGLDILNRVIDIEKR